VDDSGTTPAKTCEYCRALVPITPANGITVKYNHDMADITVSLHKSCAAAWTRQFTHAIPIRIVPID
jgi:hypothetical protein